MPWTRVRDGLTPGIAWRGRVLIDATNIFTSYAPSFEVDEPGEDSGNESVARLALSARVVKAFNTLPIDVMFASVGVALRQIPMTKLLVCIHFDL